jgi:hypothetical protein
MQIIKNYSRLLVLLLALLISCSKGDDTNSPTGGGGNNGGTNNANCLITTISQVNNSTSTESSLSVVYNNSFDIGSIIVYDSISKRKSFGADFNYITSDSVRIDQYQYMIRDASKRITRFVTRSDMNDPARADKYLFEYEYNSDGYLSRKNLFINGSAKANFQTVYTYSNGNLSACLLTAPGAGDLKVLESALSYNTNISIKNWIYTFPDALEGYPYLSVLNFGKRGNAPLSRVVTQIYEPVSGRLMDTWSTDYSNYKLDANGYITSGEAAGDLQQGIAAFYGKTKFYYTCH